MPQTMQWIAGTDALAMSVAMEARFQGRTCILCGCGESGNARPFVQDKSEYPEGIPDDLMALPLCRVCLRLNTEDIGPCEKACFMIFPCLAVTPADVLTCITTKLREVSHGQLSDWSVVVTDAMEQAGPRTAVM